MGKTDRVRGKSHREAKPAEIGVLIYPGVQLSAVGGLTDLFVTANRLSVERCAAGSRTLRITHWKFKYSSAEMECV
jgi:transcriptional regulator GlxA family with amidase domain